MSRKLSIAVCSFLCLASCGDSSLTYHCLQPQFSGHDYELTALKILDADGEWDDSPTRQEQLDALLARVEKTKPWASRIADPCMRFAVLHWLDFYASQGREHLAEQGTDRQDQDDFEKQRQQENLRIQDLKGRTVLPAQQGIER